MRADEEICGPAFYAVDAPGRALARENQDAYEDIREIIRETSLQRPDSPPWWDLAGAALAAWTVQLDMEARGPLAEDGGASGNQPSPDSRQPARSDPDEIRGTPAGVSGYASSLETARRAAPAQARLGSQSVLADWPARRLWVLGLAASFLVAAIDAALGHQAILIGLLIIGPCCVSLTGRWVLTGLTGLWVIGLAITLGLPDDIWGSAVFFTWLVVAAAALVSTAAASIHARGLVRLR
jgi:hypothetical protein